jgi:bifunctional non-homologous end joining protein LigD
LQRTLPAGFIAPCLPSKTHKLPSGSEWLHEIKHDGFRVIARKNGTQVRLYSRPGNDLTYRFPLIVETLARLRSRSCIIDGEAAACDDDGVTSFNRVRYRYHDESIFLYAFDLIELNGDDLRRDPLEGRKAALELVLAKAELGIRFNEHMDGDGEIVLASCGRQLRKLRLRDPLHLANSRERRAYCRKADMARRDWTGWLGMQDSNSEMSTQIIALKDRTDLRESSRILALETIRL